MPDPVNEETIGTDPPPVATPIPDPAPPAGETDTSALEASIAALTAEREALQAALAQAQAQAAELDADRNTQAARVNELYAQQLAAHRRALLAENRGQVIDELVAGDSTEALEASVEAAKTAYSRVVDAVKAQAAALVPAGASPRSEPTADELSPLQKITSAITRNGR